jgi:NAD(P)-dependent dehydrogenase (short-subunit alcohol dehydrogenase family)
MSGRLGGRVALVTGGMSGLGEACVQRFRDEDATVVTLDVVDGADHVVDVRDEAAVAAAVDAVVAAHGRLDVVVNSAGVAGGGPAHLVALDDWERVIGVNLTGTFLVSKHAARHMLEQRSGSIINLASVEGIEGTEGGSSYNASKGGVVLLTKNLACDYGRAGIRANAICPGFIETPMFHSVIDNLPYKDAIREQHKLGRFGRPDDIAGAAYFLASDDSAFVTGVALPVDGGYVAGHAYGIAQLFTG